MRTGDELHRAIARDGIQGNPQADVLLAIDTVIGLVMVPWGRLFGAGLLHQDMFVKKVAWRLPINWRARAAAGEPRTTASYSGISPIAVITEEMTSVVGAGVDTVIGAGRGDITVRRHAVDRSTRPRTLPEDHHPIASIGGHGLI